MFISYRSNKIQCNFSKLVEISRIKKYELEQLASQFQKLTETKTEKSKGSQKYNTSEESGVSKTG